MRGVTSTDTAAQISIFTSEDQPIQSVYDIKTRLPISDWSSHKTENRISLPMINATSPSGQFTPGREGLTSDGRTKATPGDSLRSYDDYLLLKEYFLQPAKRVYGIRNFALLTIGIATGLRISDLVSLKVGHFITLDSEGNQVFKKSIDLYEQKTGKRTINDDDEVFITEAMRDAVEMLLWAYAKSSPRSKKIKKVLNLDDWLFQSSQPDTTEWITDDEDDSHLVRNPLYGQYVLKKQSAHTIFKDAQRDLKLGIDLCTRTTRKTFLSLVVMLSRLSSPTDRSGLEMAQIMARHGDVRKTMRYIGVAKTESLDIRNQISDWLLGKGKFNTIKL